TWTPVSKGDVTLSLADSTGVVQNIATVADSLGTYDWAVPNTITPNADYKIKIAQVINPVSSDESDNYFCISANETVDIVGEWQVNYFWSKSTMYLNFKNDNTWEIVDNTTFTGVWTLVGNGLLIDPDYSDFVYIGIVTGDKIKGTTQQPPTYTGIWDANRILTVTAPNGGNVYQPADVVPITWTENLSAEYVKIDLYENDVLARTIFSNTINDNDQNWTVPADLTTSTKYKVRITSAVDQDIYDESDNYFTIEALAPAAQEDENFDDGLAQNWTAYDGTWTIADSLYRCEKDSALLASSAYYNVPLTGNYYVEADCRKVSGNFYAGIYLNADHTLIESSDNIWKSMQFMINYGQPGYFYLAYCDGVSNWVSVTYQYSAAINQGLNEWNNLKVIVDNGTNFYHLFINDVYIGSYQDNRLSSGEVGLFQYDNTGRYVSEFDNVKIGPVNKSAMDGIKIKRLNSSKPIKLGAKK
ncbi:MAG TPA: hypothetical protein PLP37_00635, partial [Clostridiales bacterium]|nr:hypothetical protein [Clostridiales bacterium]